MVLQLSAARLFTGGSTPANVISKVGDNWFTDAHWADMLQRLPDMRVRKDLSNRGSCYCGSKASVLCHQLSCKASGWLLQASLVEASHGFCISCEQSAQLAQCTAECLENTLMRIRSWFEAIINTFQLFKFACRIGRLKFHLSDIMDGSHRPEQLGHVCHRSALWNPQ